MRIRTSVTDWLGEHPVVDLVPALAVGGAGYLLPPAALDKDYLVPFLVGVAGLAGLILATATLAFQMMSQTSNEIMRALVGKNRPMLNLNWRAILSSNILAGVASLMVIPVVPLAPRAAAMVGGLLLGLAGARGIRAVHWFVIINTVDEFADRVPTPVSMPKPSYPVELHRRERVG